MDEPKPRKVSGQSDGLKNRGRGKTSGGISRKNHINRRVGVRSGRRAVKRIKDRSIDVWPEGVWQDSTVIRVGAP